MPASLSPLDRTDSARGAVAITGIGLITGLGADREATWAGLRAGRSALRDVVDRDLAGYRGARAPTAVRDGTTGEPVLNLLDAVVTEAIADADLRAATPALYAPERCALWIGSSKGGLHSLGQARRFLHHHPHDDEAIARAWLASWPSAGAGRIATRLNFRGPSLAPVAACATGLFAVLRAAAAIERGECDLALAGSVDAALEPLVLGAFQRMRILASPERPAAEAIRPWDRDRSGFLVGEGGAIFVLERADRARERGCVPYVELLGGAIGSDGYHETTLNPDPGGLAFLIQRALDDAGISAADVDHVNVHGTATRPNDPLECRAIRRALGPQADRVVCTANKGQIGHLLGAAGSAELAITCLSLRDGFVPPTMNLVNPAPDCDLDGTPYVGRSVPVRTALKVSIGFGGHHAAAVVRLPEGPRRTRRDADRLSPA
jgi:3-oxoacyl-[acyl-carrier-protein] synthase II